MKTPKLILLNLLACIFIFSCQKGLDAPGNLTSSGTLAKDGAGNCVPVNVNGIYKAGTQLSNTNYIDVTVNVTAPGDYQIQTAVLNGIHFGDSAQFTATGLQVVRLYGYGTPVGAGTFSFTVSYNNSSSCAVAISVSPVGGGTTASFTLAGAPGSCTAPVIQGTYQAGTTLNASNKLIVGVNVTSIGDYTLSTAIVNGISFSATGTFSVTGVQTVTLSGTGTPVIAGTNQMSVSGTAASCSFPLTVGTMSGSGTYLSAVYAFDTTLAAPFDTIARFHITWDAQNRVTVITEYDTKPNGDSAYYGIQNFYYTGNDSFATRKTEYYKEFSSTPVFTGGGTNYYTFVNGRCVYDSSVANTGGSYYAVSYVYVGNNVQRNARGFSGGTMSYGYSTVYKTFVNGNNTHQVDTSVSYFNILIPSSYFYQAEEISTSYLTNPNPFYQVRKQVLRPYFYDDIGITGEAAPPYLIAQQNEHMETWTGSNPPGTIRLNQLNYTYTFRPDGYPLEARHTIVRSGITSKGKMIFVYR